MPSKSIHCIVDFDVCAVTCPGVWLPKRHDVYLSVCFLGQYRKTCLASPTFPILYRESLRFEKTFHNVRSPSQVLRLLEGQHVLIELIQISPYHEEGILLAFYECSAKNFLYPRDLSNANGINRFLLFEKTNDFPSHGLSPRLEYRTFTSMADDVEEDEYATFRRTRTQIHGYEQPTFSSAIRALEVSQIHEPRPKFATRKVDDTLIGRVPGAPARIARKKRSKSAAPLSPYASYSYESPSVVVEPCVPRLRSPVPIRALASTSALNWEPPYPYPPYPYCHGYDSIDLLARDLEMSSLRM